MIIGITGTKGSGKDTIANHLVETGGFVRVAFADQLKQAVANLFEVNRELIDEWKSDSEIPLAEVILQVGTTQWSWSWREFLQRFGTEMGRETFGERFWIDQWEDYLYRNSMQDDKIVVPDVRFDNEAVYILRGSPDNRIIEVTRPGHEPDGHVSEDRLYEGNISVTIENNGTIEELLAKVDAWGEAPSP